MDNDGMAPGGGTHLTGDPGEVHRIWPTLVENWMRERTLL